MNPPDNVGRTIAVSERIDAGRGRIYPCDACGADLTFDIGEQQLSCSYCGAARALSIDPERVVREQEYEARLKWLARQRSETSSDITIHVVRCSTCAAEVTFPGELTSSSCAFCGSPVQSEERQQDPNRIPTDAVLPFAIEMTKAEDRVSAWVSSRWFAPNRFKRDGAEGKLVGVYLPYWTFDSHTFTRYDGQRGDHYYVTVGTGKNRRRKRKTRWSPASGSFSRFFDDVLVLTSRGAHETLVRNLEPWPLKDVIPFTPDVLAGLLAETYVIELDSGFSEARSRIAIAIDRDVRRRIGGDVQRVHSVDSRHDPVHYKHILLPVWLMSYRHGARVYQVAINGATGEVEGERPWSAWKIAFAVIGGLIALGVILVLLRGFGGGEGITLNFSTH